MEHVTTGLTTRDRRDDPLLDVRNVTLAFGGVTSLRDVSFTVETGELFAVIGPNGAGKTSIFNCLNGVYRPQEGSIRFDGTELVGRRPPAIARLGVARTFQNLGTVREPERDRQPHARPPCAHPVRLPLGHGVGRTGAA